MKRLTNDGVIHQGHVLDILREMPDESIDCVITSPPYWTLRSYKTEPQVWGGVKDCQHQWEATLPDHRFGRMKQPIYPNAEDAPDRRGIPGTGKSCRLCGAWCGELGLEPTFNLYLDHLIEIFGEVKRVMKKTATLWVNIGDTYATHTGKSSAQFNGDINDERNSIFTNNRKRQSVPEKSLCQIPERFSIRITDELGFIKRNTIIWYKPNLAPSSANDRFTVDFDPIYFYAKSQKYYFEQQFEPMQESSIRRAFSVNHLEKRKNRENKTFSISGDRQEKSFAKLREKIKNGEKVFRNKRTVWTIPTRGISDAHFAVFPEKLPVTPIKAGCPEFV